jgi:hypothetical protein
MNKDCSDAAKLEGLSHCCMSCHDDAEMDTLYPLLTYLDQNGDKWTICCNVHAFLKTKGFQLSSC